MTKPEPASVLTVPGEDGGLTATVVVPTYSGGQSFTIAVERDADGDWRVYIPWSKEFGGEPMRMEDGTEVSNGIIYLGAPDE